MGNYEVKTLNSSVSPRRPHKQDWELGREVGTTRAWQPGKTECTATPSRTGYPQLKGKSFMINSTILYPDELTAQFR